MNIYARTVNLACEFLLDLIIIWLFPTNPIRRIFLVMMKSVKVEENMVTAASQSTKKSL